MARVVAIIPALNEAGTIRQVASEALRHAHVVVVVDDGSSDETAAEARASGAVVVRRPCNGGKGAALREGFTVALDQGADAIVTLDADGQHDARDISRVVAPILAGEADVVVGSRVLDAQRIPKHRRVGQYLFRQAAQASATLTVSDTESGFRAYDAALLRKLDLREDGYASEWEALVMAANRGARIVEVPIRAVYDVPTPSKTHPIVHGMDVGRAILRFVRVEHPLVFFALPGFGLLLAGAILGAQTADGYYNEGIFWPGKAMLSMLFMLLGVVLLLSALVLDALAELFHKVEARHP